MLGRGQDVLPVDAWPWPGGCRDTAPRVLRLCCTVGRTCRSEPKLLLTAEVAALPALNNYNGNSERKPSLCFWSPRVLCLCLLLRVC